MAGGGTSGVGGSTENETPVNGPRGAKSRVRFSHSCSQSLNSQ